MSYVDRRHLPWLAIAATGLSVAFAVEGALTFGTPTTEGVGAWMPALSVPLQVKVDGLSVLVASFVSFISFLVVVYSLGYMKDEEGQTRYYSLVLLFVGSMMGLVMAGNLVQLYFFWELVGICSALLIAFWTDREAARKAGLKSFVVTRFGDSSLLIAVIFTFTLFGTTSFDSILGPQGVSTLGSGTAFILGLLILIGAMGKSAQVPLHAWLPDAMEGPSTVSALIHAATMVNAGVFLMIRMYPLFQLSATLLDTVFAVGALSALVGGLCAFAADDLKRVLAYSTISQLGLMFAAIGLGNWPAATYHMISQGLFKALAFLAAGSVVTALGTRDIGKMGGLARSMKYTYAGFLVSVLAMCGLPPLIGFWSKDAIISSAFGSGLLAATLLLSASSLTALYSFRALYRVFHGAPRSGGTPHESPLSMVAPMAVLSITLATSWVVLQSQTLITFAAFSSPEFSPFVVALVVLAASASAAYLVSLRYHGAAVQLITVNGPMKGLRGLLFDGFLFDKLYAGIYAGLVVPLSRAASLLQTGLVGSNTALALGAVVVIFVLYGLGVL